MSSPMTASGLPELAVFARRLSVLIGSGVSLVRALSILEKDSSAQMAQALRHVRERILEGACFSEATAGARAVFPLNVTIAVRAGEISGTLDESFLWLASFLERICSMPESDEKNRLTALAQNGTAPAAGADEAAGRLLRRSWFFAMFSMSLSAGTPLEMALETASDVLSDGDRAEMTALIRSATAGESPDWDEMQTWNWFHAFAAQTLSAGKADGRLAAAASRIADACEAELFCRVGSA